MQRIYPEAYEEIDTSFPEPKGHPIQTTIWYDSNWAHDQVTRRSNTGLMAYVGGTLVKAYSKRQGAIAAATYASSRYLQTGPTAMTALLAFGAVSVLATPGSVDYVGLALLLAIVVGVARLVLGLLKAGALKIGRAHV